MGWSGGSGLFADTWGLVRKYIPKEKQSAVLKKWISRYQDDDCDTIYECFDEFPEVEKVYRRMYPDEFEDEK